MSLTPFPAEGIGSNTHAAQCALRIAPTRTESFPPSFDRVFLCPLLLSMNVVQSCASELRRANHGEIGMTQKFERIVITPQNSSTEFVVLESELSIDFGNGQGPRAGYVTIKDGGLVVRGTGDAVLTSGSTEQGGKFPPKLILGTSDSPSVEIAAHPDPTGQPHRANVYIEGSTGSITMKSAAGKETALLEGSKGNLWLGGHGVDGDLLLFPAAQISNRNTGKASIHLDGSSGSITARSPAGKDTIFVDGAKGEIWVGGNGISGTLSLFPASAGSTRSSASASIHLDGEQGDIILRHADCAEDFDIEPFADVEPGTVMVIGDDQRLRPCSESYDRRVAGVVSGGGIYRPGIVLDRQPSSDNRAPVALVGKVYCKVDASRLPVRIGDLLTTAEHTGHAMRVEDPMRAFGAVIGKALAPLDSGKGLIPILVALQ